MNWNLVTYADERFGSLSVDQQQFVHRVHASTASYSYGREWLEKTDFYRENKELLDNEVGGGFWAWKPYIILDVMKKTQEGDFIIYCDRKDMFSPGLFNYVENNLEPDEFCMLLLGNSINGQYTKRDTFILMECDEEDYWNSKQLEAGFSVWKNCEKSIDILNQYLKYCLDYKIVSGDESVLGEERDGFKEHRYDQSILTNIAIREGLTVGGPEYRNYIECDYDYWYERNEKFGFNLGREIDSFLLSIKNA